MPMTVLDKLNNTMILTKPQRELLSRMWVAPVRLYGSEWMAFYKLRAKGFADYMVSDDGKRNYSYGVITETGKSANPAVAS